MNGVFSKVSWLFGQILPMLVLMVILIVAMLYFDKKRDIAYYEKTKAKYVIFNLMWIPLYVFLVRIPAQYYGGQIACDEWLNTVKVVGQGGLDRCAMVAWYANSMLHWALFFVTFIGIGIFLYRRYQNKYRHMM